MKIKTGQTIYENVLSFDNLNNPITGATFDTQMFKNGVLFTGITVSETLSDSTRALFLFSWSASTLGDYQLYVNNNTTTVLFMSDTYSVVSDDEANMTVYVGL